MILHIFPCRKCTGRQTGSFELTPRPSRTQLRDPQTNHFDFMSAGEKRLKLLLEHTTMHDVTSGAGLALRVFESRNREAPTFLSHHPQFQWCFHHLIHHHKTRLCLCDPPVGQKNLCHLGTRSLISLLSHLEP